ncbi:hypothetical protein [Streptomyces griseoflavus]|uniref:hypothetical protein n=1 Tax=Streptomyces griseoflavus TaxID=35619 RepID=UPI0033D3DB73
MPSPASWIGVLHTHSGPVGLKAFMQTLTLETTVTDQQLRGLEKLRAGADLSLRAQLTLTALEYAKHWPVVQDQEIIRIPHAAWSNALVQLDAGAFVDVLIPVTTVEARATGAGRIREAKTAIRDGRYEHAVALARRRRGSKWSSPMRYLLSRVTGSVTTSGSTVSSPAQRRR